MKNKFHFVFLFSLFFFGRNNFLFSQNAYNDSLKKVIATSPVDSEKVKAMNELGWQLKTIGNFGEAMKNADAALTLAAKINYPRGKGFSYNLIGGIYYNQSQYIEALEFYNKSLSIRDSLGDKKGTASAYNNMGNVYISKGDYEKAVDAYLKSLKIREAIGNKADLAVSYGNIANVYGDKGDAAKEKEYYLKCLNLGRELHDSDIVCAMLMNFGNIYLDHYKLDSALYYYTTAAGYFAFHDNKSRLAVLYNSIGNVYNYKQENDPALEYYIKSYNLDESIGNRGGMAVSSDNIGAILMKKERYPEAKDELLNALSIAKETNAWPDLMRTYHLLGVCDSSTGNFKEAFYYQRLWSDIKDSITNDANNEHIAKMNAQYAGEKKDQEIILLNKDKEKQAALNEQDAQRKNIVISFVGGGLLLVLGFAIYIFRSYRGKQKVNLELEEKNNLIENQKKIVEERNKEVTDSILYAKKIQRALLASDNVLAKNLPQHFVFYMPKDIVSGDFYWASAANEKFFLATCDCTGHGVPGAFMSLLNISFLNEAVNEKKIQSPELILNHVRGQIISALNPEGTNAEGRDGMDGVLCSFNFKENLLEFSCANNAVWIIRDGKMIEYKPDKMPVGMFEGEKKSFSLQSARLQKGDLVYTFSDGYADQFGGPKGKKFKYSQLKELLLSIHNLPVEEQKKILSEKFIAWKGNLEQVDDVLVIGVRV